jgi:hypothetical protein
MNCIAGLWGSSREPLPGVARICQFWKRAAVHLRRDNCEPEGACENLTGQPFELIERIGEGRNMFSFTTLPLSTSARHPAIHRQEASIAILKRNVPAIISPTAG